MDRISKQLLNDFSREHDIASLAEDRQFEHFACFVTVGSHYGESFDTGDILVGTANGIDGIAIIVNGVLIGDIDTLNDMSSVNDLDVSFIFIQAATSANFDSGKIGSFGFAVNDFFSDAPKLPRNPKVSATAEIMNALYKRSSMFKRANPICRLYYVTTGVSPDDPTLQARCQTIKTDLRATNLFRDVTFTLVGAEGVQKLYNQTKNAIEREFLFKNRVVLPEVSNVTEAYLGFLPVPEFMKIVSQDGEIIASLFHSNPRDW